MELDLLAIVVAALIPSLSLIFADGRRRRLALERGIVQHGDEATLRAGHDEQAYAQVYWAHACVSQTRCAAIGVLAMVGVLAYLAWPTSQDVVDWLPVAIMALAALGALSMWWLEEKSAGAIKELSKLANKQLPKGMQSKVLAPRIGSG